MRSSGEVAQKLKQAAYRRMKRELTRLLRQAPENCTESRILKVRDEEVRFCRDDYKVCDRRFEDRSKGCDLYRCKHDKDRVKREFQKFMATEDIPEIAVRFPDVAALMWVLDSEPNDAQRGALFPEGIPVSTLYGIELWADTPEESEQAADILRQLLKDSKSLEDASREAEKQKLQADSLLREKASLEGELEEVTKLLGQAEAQVKNLREQAEARRKAAEALAKQEEPEPSWWRKLWKS